MMRRRALTFWRSACFAAAASCAVAFSPVANAAVVVTEDGPVKGTETPTMREFLGIPYAAPPIGDLRWRPPVPHARWFMPRDATKFANHCPQPPSPFGIASLTEDCLFLNVFTPRDEGDRDEDRDDHGRHHRPVMVWIHGGALVVGESDDYDPTKLVQQGVVVVTINYRLGALGFLAHPAFAAESTDADHDRDHESGAGDYGLMDQQLALAWVKRNIEAFGGDPDNVTIFGESAGGLSTFSQLASPVANGLFHKAIIESGAYRLDLPSLATAEQQGAAFATAVGCTDQSAACLRALPVTTILANENPAGYVPNTDGEILPMSLGAAFAAGKFNRVPIIQGSNHDEWRLFVALDFDLLGHPITPQTYQAAIASLVGPTFAPIVAAQYPLSNFPSPDIAFGAVGTDLIFDCPARLADQLLSQFVPVFAYEFNDENAPEDFLPPVTFPYGAAHASEIQYLFDLPITVPRPPLNVNQQSLSDAMVRYWTQFARKGDPNRFGVPFWRPFSAKADNFQSLLPPSPQGETNFATAHHCGFWAPILTGTLTASN